MVWAACDGARQIRPISGRLFRLVENQEQVATLGYVDTLAEQALLEEMLEAAKPPYPDTTSGLDYLLKTPFRYPPLRWGSRFGRTHEPGIFYGGHSVEVTLAESAFYRFVFWHSMEAPPPKPRLYSHHSLFSAGYESGKGVKMQEPPFLDYALTLAHPADYSHSQALGSAMRESGVEVFEYLSARDPQKGICVGLFSPASFSDRSPQDLSRWWCELSAEEVQFKQEGESRIYHFGLALFLVAGTLPFPPS